MSWVEDIERETTYYPGPVRFVVRLVQAIAAAWRARRPAPRRAPLPMCLRCQHSVTAIVPDTTTGGMLFTITCHNMTTVRFVPHAFFVEFGDRDDFPALLATRLGLRDVG